MKAVKVGDIGTDHDGFPPTKVIAGSPDVFIDGKPAARVGDPLQPHDKPKNPMHDRAIASGSSTVFINGKPAALTGGGVSCGGVTIGSGTMNIGDETAIASVVKNSQKVFNRKFKIVNEAGAPLKDVEYRLETSDGSVVEGKTNSHGETSYAYKAGSPLSVKLFVKE